MNIENLNNSQLININGVIPKIAVKAGHSPERSETGIGALMPWANKLWFVTYLANKYPSGSGTGLFYLDDDFCLTKHAESMAGTYANRMIHSESNQLIIGPHLIDMEGNVRTVAAYHEHTLTATAEHLTDPEDLVYMLSMEGELFELNVHTLETKQIANLAKELDIDKDAMLHFKGAYTGQGRLVVVNNTYGYKDFNGEVSHGRLAEWNGKHWSILDRAQYNEVTGRKCVALGDAIFVVGSDKASAILKVLIKGQWQTYRMPKGTATQDHAITTEWPRIREVESERWLMDASGIFYEMPAMQYGDRIWGVKPVCSHLRIVGDYCSWNGLLVMAGDQATPIWDNNKFVGQPQANLWFGKTDDLWQWGKPTGWGGPWFKTQVKSGEPSAPYLMTGFDKKCIHIHHDQPKLLKIRIEVDITGFGDWHEYDTLEIPANGYRHHEFQSGFSAHWIRLISDMDCISTAQLHYT